MPYSDPEDRKRYHKDYIQKWYQKNKKAHKANTARNRQLAIEENHRLLWEFLDDKSCADCKTDDKRVLEFDHVREQKDATIARMVSGGFGWNRILAEIAKCEIVCANCHKIRTAERGNFWRHVKHTSSCGVTDNTVVS